MEAAAQTDTQVALAQLYAHVNAMPESAKKKKLLKQFNKANGTGTPCVNRHKRSKSFGESIKVSGMILFEYFYNLRCEI